MLFELSYIEGMTLQPVPFILLFQIDNVQSLIQCPGVLVCVGCEPSHPSIVENFRKTLNDKLPKLNVRSRAGGCNEGHKGTKYCLLTQMSFLNDVFTFTY